ncbi:MAG: hypothetical protein FWC89_02775 [Defluviitaleaceae bacterium]|nr:hypothetical protein [Defluviitaleaceae bacterium]
MSDKPKKKKGTKYVVGCICALCLVIAGGIFLDFGDGIPFIGNGDPSNGYDYDAPPPEIPEITLPDPIEPDEDLPVEVAPPNLRIRIVENEIIHNDQTLTLEELRALITELHQPDYEWEVHHERAIAATLEDVLLLFEEFEITPTQTAGAAA